MDLAKKDEREAAAWCSSIRRSSRSPRTRIVHEEGCLSIPEYYEEVERPAEVTVRYLDLDGKEQEIEADGLLATCLQHEIDHLNGVLFIDHISKLKRDRVVKKFTKAAKQAGKDERKRRSQVRGEVTCRCASIFMGTPDFAVPTLLELAGHGHDVVAVYTRAPKPGRPPRPRADAVAGRARGAQARPCRCSRRASLKGADAQAAFAAHGADVAVVVAYGLILPKPILDAPCRSAASTCTPRCCRAGAAPRRSSARSWRATPRPASR